jgi:hypothetical protein
MSDKYKERKDNNDIIHRPAPFDVPQQIYAAFKHCIHDELGAAFAKQK